MDTTKLLEAARKDGGEQEHSALLQAELQAGVQEVTIKLATENAELKASVARMEKSHTKMADEWKPVQSLLKAAEIGWKPDDLVLLEDRLNKGGKPTEDVLKLARELAGPMATEATKELLESAEKAATDLEAAHGLTAAAVSRADTSNLQLMMQAAQGGKDAPQLIPAFADTFREKILEPYAHWSEVTSAGGQVRRVLEYRDGDVPIVTSVGPASTADMMKTAYEGKGDKAWSTQTRDYYQSNGGGAGTPPQGGPGELPVGQKALANTKTLVEYEAERGKGRQ